MKRKRRRMSGGSLTIIFDRNRTASFFSRGDAPTDPHHWIADALNALETNLVRMHGGRMVIIHGTLCIPFEEVGTPEAEHTISGCLSTVWGICAETAVRDAQARRDAFVVEGSRHIVEAWHPTFTVEPLIVHDARGCACTVLHRIALHVVSPVIRTVAFGVSRLDPTHPPYFVLEVGWKRDGEVFPNIMTVLRLLRGDAEDIHNFEKRLQEHRRYPLSNDTSIKGIGDAMYRTSEDMDDPESAG